MINLKIIYKVLGSLLFIEVVMLFCCLMMSIYYQEDDMMAFIVTIALTTAAGVALKYKGYHAEQTVDNGRNPREYIYRCADDLDKNTVFLRVLIKRYGCHNTYRNSDNQAQGNRHKR